MRSVGLRLTAGIVALTVASLTGVYAAQQPAAGARSTPDISGFWELSFDGRKVPPAALAPGVTRAMLDAQAKRDAHAIRWCNTLGMPFLMDPGRPIDVRQGQREVVIQAEAWAIPRHIYLNRASHISADIYDPLTTGDSIARWEGDTLVVETIGIAENRGITAIPGGGFRLPTTKLTERFRLLQNGSLLSVTFTWTDPKMFRTPHTYEYRYRKLPATYEPAPILPCDPYDEERVKFLAGQ